MKIMKIIFINSVQKNIKDSIKLNKYNNDEISLNICYT